MSIPLSLSLSLFFSFYDSLYIYSVSFLSNPFVTLSIFVGLYLCPSIFSVAVIVSFLPNPFDSFFDSFFISVLSLSSLFSLSVCLFCCLFLCLFNHFVSFFAFFFVFFFISIPSLSTHFPLVPLSLS